MAEEDFQEQEADTINEEEIDALIARTNAAESKNVELTQALGSLNSSKKDENFLHHQISTNEMLEKLEHFYKGDFQGIDKEGNTVWLKQKNKELITFNEFGVTSLMEIITKYIDKNTMLSYYDSQRIYEILADVGEDSVLFLLCNYEKIGMDTHFKKTKFRLIITTTLHIIESTYRRALNGRTMEEINQSKVVSQFSNIPISQQQSSYSKPGFSMNKFFGNR